MAPVMNGCMEQWYLNVPAVPKVWVKVWPLPIGEEANDLSSATTVCCAESSNFQVTVVPTETVRVIGVNMKFLISTFDPPLTAAEPLEAGAAAVAGVEDADVPPPVELEPHAVATTKTAISATKTTSGWRGRTEDLRDVSARFMGAPFSRGDAGRDCPIMATASEPRWPAAHTMGFTRPVRDATCEAPICQGSQAGPGQSRNPVHVWNGAAALRLNTALLAATRCMLRISETKLPYRLE